MYIMAFPDLSLVALSVSDVEESLNGFCVVEVCAMENTSLFLFGWRGRGTRCCTLGVNCMFSGVTVKGKEAEKDTRKETMMMYKMNECMVFQ